MNWYRSKRNYDDGTWYVQRYDGSIVVSGLNELSATGKAYTLNQNLEPMKKVLEIAQKNNGNINRL